MSETSSQALSRFVAKARWLLCFCAENITSMCKRLSAGNTSLSVEEVEIAEPKTGDQNSWVRESDV